MKLVMKTEAGTPGGVGSGVLDLSEALGVGSNTGVLWSSPDRGVPLSAITSAPTDPFTIWETQPSVRKVVGFAARQIAQLPWHAFQSKPGKKGRERLRDSAAERLFREPSLLVTGYSLIEQLIIDYLLYDRFLAVLLDDELVRMSPKLWKLKSDWVGRVRKVVLHTPQGVDDVDLLEANATMMIGWGWSDTKAGGVSPMKTLRDLLFESRESVKWRARQWEDRPRFNGLLKHPSRFHNDKTRERFEQTWDDWLSGKRRGTPVLEDGLEYDTTPQLMPGEVNDIEGRKLTDEEVASAFHIPPEMVGARAGNFSNMQAFRSMLFGPTLGPIIQQLEQAANKMVPELDAREGVYLEVSRDAAVNGSLIEQARVLQSMTGGPSMTREEARDRMNLPFIEGTDQLIVPLNVLVGGQASPTDSGSQNETDAQGPDQNHGGVGAGTSPGGSRAAQGKASAGGALPDDAVIATSAATVAQKVYLAVGNVMTQEEARDLVRRAGAVLGDSPPDAEGPAASKESEPGESPREEEPEGVEEEPPPNSEEEEENE